MGVSYSLKIKYWMVHRGSLWGSGGRDLGIFISFRERASKERMIENLGDRRDDKWSVEEMDS